MSSNSPRAATVPANCDSYCQPFGHSQLRDRYSYTRVYREFTRGFVNPTDIFSGYELSKCKSCQIHPRSVSGTYNRDQTGFGLHIRSSKAQIHFFDHIAFSAKIIYPTSICKAGIPNSKFIYPKAEIHPAGLVLAASPAR